MPHPLTNTRILITRTRDQASSLSIQLKALGADTILIPTIELAPPTSLLPLLSALAQVSTFDWLLFTSANAVDAFARYRNPALKPRKIAAIGPATAATLSGIGLVADLIPSASVGEALAQALLPLMAQPPATPTRVLLIRAEQARDTLPQLLIAAGADLHIAPAYRTITPPGSGDALRSLFARSVRHPHAITFTSSSTALNFFALLDAAGIQLPPGIALASIGTITTQTLRHLGHPPDLEAGEPTIPSLVAALTAHFQGSAALREL